MRAAGIIYKKTLLTLLVFLLSPLMLVSMEKGEIERRLDEVIAQEKYTYESLEPAPGSEKNIPPWLGVILSIIKASIGAVKRFLELLQDRSPLLYLGFVGLTILILGGLIIFLVRQVTFSITKRKKPPKQIRLYSGHFNYEKELMEAARLLKEGAYVKALPLLLNALWLYFHARKVTAYSRSKTNREYLRELGSREDFSLVQTIVYQAENAVYAKEPIDEKEANRIFEQVKEIINH